jgi:hypothetical protein
LVAAILDVSTIATSAVGAFPAQLVADNQTLSQGMKNSALYNQLKS